MNPIDAPDCGNDFELLGVIEVDAPVTFCHLREKSLNHPWTLHLAHSRN